MSRLGGSAPEVDTDEHAEGVAQVIEVRSQPAGQGLQDSAHLRFFLGGEVLRPFALAMAIGIVVGTYSSIFIAAPTLLWLENRFGGVAEAADAGAKIGAAAAMVMDDEEEDSE